MKTTHFAALTLSALAVITGVSAAVTTWDVTPRTVIAEPAPADEPCPYPYPDARCAPEPPAPAGMTDEEGADMAAEYSAAWAEIEVGR